MKEYADYSGKYSQLKEQLEEILSIVTEDVIISNLTQQQRFILTKAQEHSNRYCKELIKDISPILHSIKTEYGKSSSIYKEILELFVKIIIGLQSYQISHIVGVIIMSQQMNEKPDIKELNSLKDSVSILEFMKKFDMNQELREEL